MTGWIHARMTTQRTERRPTMTIHRPPTSAAEENVVSAIAERAQLGYTLGAQEGEAFWLLGMLQTIRIGRADTAGQYGLLEIVVPAGHGSPWHVHPEEDEWFYVLDGELTVYVGDIRLSLPAGSFAFGPKGIPLLSRRSGDALGLRTAQPRRPRGASPVLRRWGRAAHHLLCSRGPGDGPDTHARGGGRSAPHRLRRLTRGLRASGPRSGYGGLSQHRSGRPWLHGFAVLPGSQRLPDRAGLLQVHPTRGSLGRHGSDPRNPVHAGSGRGPGIFRDYNGHEARRSRPRWFR